MSAIHNPSALAAERGEPSYVWRSGQERRLAMIANAAPLENARILVDGCGIGAEAKQFLSRFTPHVEGGLLEYSAAGGSGRGRGGAVRSAGRNRYLRGAGARYRQS